MFFKKACKRKQRKSKSMLLTSNLLYGILKSIQQEVIL